MSEKDTQKIKVGLWNATGLQNNLDRLIETMKTLEIDVCIVTETWYHQLSIIPTKYVRLYLHIQNRQGQEGKME